MVVSLNINEPIQIFIKKKKLQHIYGGSKKMNQILKTDKNANER